MTRRPPQSTRTYPLFPYTPLVRSHACTSYLSPKNIRAAGDERDGLVERHAAFDMAMDRGIGVGVGGEDRRRERVEHEPSDRFDLGALDIRSEEHTSELQSLMRISYAVFCLKNKNTKKNITNT